MDTKIKNFWCECGCSVVNPCTNDEFDNWEQDEEMRHIAPNCLKKAAAQPPTPAPAEKINPDHYKSHPSGVECITITEHMNFNVGNAIKYLWRNGLKGSESSIDDLTKARWCIDREIKRLSK